MSGSTYRAAVIGLGRMGSTFDDEITQGGSIFLPYCHAPTYHAATNIELVSGADPHDEQRQIFGQRWGLDEGHLYADYRQMLRQTTEASDAFHYFAFMTNAGSLIGRRAYLPYGLKLFGNLFVRNALPIWKSWVCMFSLYVLKYIFSRRIITFTNDV